MNLNSQKIASSGKLLVMAFFCKTDGLKVSWRFYHSRYDTNKTTYLVVIYWYNFLISPIFSWLLKKLRNHGLSDQ